MIKRICVCGSGTMGYGIAQVSAQSGFDTILFDVNEPALEKAKENILKNLQHLADKNKITVDEKETFLKKINFTKDIKDCKADVIIEAIIESAEAKISLFKELADINNSESIFASNSSSLSISQIQKDIINPERLAGLHFFNPAPLMKLVEVVKGNETNETVIQSLVQLATKMNKTPVVCNDSPGFIVNRVARHYYLEAMKLAEDGVTTFEDIDNIMESSGFKMGPFRLMDLIGMDVNLSVSQSLYKAFEEAVRFTPSQIQIDKVSKGELGRKTGKGFYNYDDKN